MRLLGGLVIISVLAAAAVLLWPVRRPPGPAPGPVRIITYNAFVQPRDPATTIGLLLEADADLVCLQETTPAWERLLRGRLSWKYPHMAFRHADHGGGLALLAKHAFKQQAHVRPEVRGSWFPGWIVLAQTPAGEVQLLIVHLRANVSDKGRLTPQSLVQTPRIRLAEIQDLWRRLDADRPTVILGDFNEEDSGKTLRWLAGMRMTNALGQFDRDSHTWRWPHRLAILRRRFDHILHSPHFHCRHAWVVKKGASDHFPVAAILERRPQTGPGPKDRPSPSRL
jgi:endonuclease/exonuclease/phosphatase (EEP) superfamily protein YafD